MPISSETRKSLCRLASLAVRESDPPDSATIASSGFREGLVPARLREEGDTEELALAMYGDEYRAFKETLRRLASEPELEHLQPRDIDSSLWELICELSIERSTFRNTRKRSARLQSYLATITRPHTPFQVAVLIENLRVEGPIDVAGVRIEHWGSDEASNWAIREGSDLTTDFVDTTVAIASVKAGKADRAVERARVLIDRALDMLRFGYSASSSIRIRDNEVMFRQGDMSLTREEGGARLHSWSLRFRPYKAALAVPLISRTTNHLEPVERVLSNNDLQLRFKRRFSLAVHWIAVAMTRVDYDEKLVDICTALESLFTEKSDGRKGELIALRAMLLQYALDGHFADTFPLLGLYQTRSRIVHGSDINLCGEGHYTYLFGATARLIMQAVRLVNENPSVRRFRDFRSILESEEMLRVAIRWFEGYGDYGKAIVGEAKKLLPDPERN